MDQLPVEIQEKIFNHFLWDQIGELYRLRSVSKAWKSIIDKLTSRLFKVWYSRCKAEIPEEHLTDIVQAKYPMVAQPWQKSYWVDSRLPHVAKDAYEIWKSFPNFDDGIDSTKLNCDMELGFFGRVGAGINDKYYGRCIFHGETTSWITEIYQWNNKSYFRKYDLDCNQVDFYTSKKGTFVLLASYDKETNVIQNYISKHPIDNLDLPSELILLERNDQYRITQNEWFFMIEGDSTRPKVLEHGILTERGFETSAIIEPPAEMSRHEWYHFRVEISGCTLYIVHIVGRLFGYCDTVEENRLRIAKYNISRNSNGKMSFAFKELIVVDKNNQKHRELHEHMTNVFYFDVYTENLRLTDYALAMEKYNPWLKAAVNRKIRALAVHANFVICEDQTSEKTGICIFQKDNLIECIESNDPDHLKPALRFDLPISTELIWIGIIYNGVKAQLLVQHYDHELGHINFY